MQKYFFNAFFHSLAILKRGGGYYQLFFIFIATPVSHRERKTCLWLMFGVKKCKLKNIEVIHKKEYSSAIAKMSTFRPKISTIFEYSQMSRLYQLIYGLLSHCTSCGFCSISACAKMFKLVSLPQFHIEFYLLFQI